jgi:tetratricopeptide (TPR) repeat protein
MPRIARLLLVACVALGSLFAGWRIWGGMRAERLAEDAPQAALASRPHDPNALLALAKERLAGGDIAGARAAAQGLLAHEPLQGGAFGVLAAAADKEGDKAHARTLYALAAKHSPRDVGARAWLTQDALEQGRHAEALAHIDVILRLQPARARALHPLLVQLAQDEAFADALAATLAKSPPWRSGFLDAVRTPGSANSLVEGRLMERLRAQGSVSPAEYARWLDSLLQQGRWGEAYARWAEGAVLRNGRLPLLYNGDFAQMPGDAAFDWHLRKIPGVLVQFEDAGKGSGRAAYLRFLDRRIPHAGLEQPVMLQPGNYTLRLRMRARALRSEMGLQWQVVCAGRAGVAGRSEPLDGSFDWRHIEVTVSVPDKDCPGQWVRLVNPVPAGAAQRISGEAWVRDFTLERQT